MIVCQDSYAQETGGKKLRNTEKTKAKGNPNKSKQKVESSDPAKWDWSKIMWFKAKKKDYRTKKYNPNKKTKRKKYDNDVEIRSESRKPGEGNDPLPRPLIPYDTRIDDEGPILIKKRKAKKKNIDGEGPRVEVPSISLNRPEELLYKKGKEKKPQDVNGKKLFSIEKKEDDRKPFDQSRLETHTIREDPSKIDDDKLFTIKVKDLKPEKMDEDKLLTIKVKENKPQKMDDDKLLTIKVKDNKPQEMDNKRLETVNMPSKERKPYDYDKLNTVVVTKPKKQDLNDDRLMINVPKIERSKLHDDRLLTIDQKEWPSKTMKKLAEDIADYEGTYEISTKKGKDYHPSARHLSSKRHGIKWLGNVQQGLSMFWSKIWPWDLQPDAVTDKKPKLKRDRKERVIWEEDSRDPESWKQGEEQAESGEEN